ncbi:MAG: hypothetical protein AB8B66_00215 [Rickettsiaceae bacterium]
MKFCCTTFSILCLFLLNACGLKPLYKADNDSYQLLRTIEIKPINSIEGAEFYNHLSNIFPPSLKPKYLLTTKLTFSHKPSLIQVNSDILRKTVTIKVKYCINNIRTKEILIQGEFSRLASYSTTFSAYINDTQKQSILKNLALISAEEVRNRVILHLENNQKK